MPTASPTTDRRPTTLTELARSVNLSSTTVSFVINGHAKKRKIPDATVDRVLKAAAQADYVPNGLARGLRRSRTHTVGLVFPHLRGDWAHRITRGVAQVMGEGDTTPIIVCHHGSASLEETLLQKLVEQQVDGIICNPLADGGERYQRVVDRGVPLVFLSDPPKGLDHISSTGWDPAEVGVVARHLIDLGHRRVAYLGVRDNRKLSTARRHAFRDSLAKAGISIPKENLILNQPGEPFHNAIARLATAEHRPTAVFAVYDDIAIQALQQFEACGLRCPHDISVATIGDSPLARAPGINLTTVSAPVEAEGEACAELLLQLIDGRHDRPEHRLVKGGNLIEGRTTSPPPQELQS